VFVFFSVTVMVIRYNQVFVDLKQPLEVSLHVHLCYGLLYSLYIMTLLWKQSRFLYTELALI